MYYINPKGSYLNYLLFSLARGTPSRRAALLVHTVTSVGCMTSRARFPPIVVHSHARSGSTLLLELLGRDPQVWTAYEPLQDVRQLPPTAPVVTDRCRSAETGAAGDPLMAKCPWRDATLLVALLACDTLPLLATWYADFELGGRSGGFVPHYDPPIPGSEWANTSLFPQMAVTRAAQYREQVRACRERPGKAIKTVRMNGQLDALYKVSHAFGKKPPLVLHLVRKPFSVYASRKNLTNSFGLPSTAETTPAHRQRLLRDWAQSTCTATRRDIATGKAQAAGAYDLVTFAELVRRPRQLAERLYSRHFHRPVPRAVYSYISTHIQPNESAVESDAWEFKYGTSARSIERVEQRWREQLEPWEVREIEAVCGRGALTSSDRGGGGGGSEESSSPAEASRYGKVGVGGKPKAARPGKAQRRSGR